jgi:cobalt-precorrin-5B (C1)-methyltransferase
MEGDVPDPAPSALRHGYTTGACAAAAAKAALAALLDLPRRETVEITLPRGERVSFTLAALRREGEQAEATIVKDAGDDPDITHGAAIQVTLSPAPPGAGVIFRAGPGVGVVTLPGLPLPPGEPAINPVPRRMITAALAELAAAGKGLDFTVTVGVADGERLAAHTLNPRLGIRGGLSILGTTGIVVPYSAAAWIATIARSIDVARAAGLSHLAAATGRSSAEAASRRHRLPELALIEMGDYAEATLKYVRRHPPLRFTLAGGIAKLAKFAQGAGDLHAARAALDFAALAALAAGAGAPPPLAAAIREAPSVLAAHRLAEAAGVPLAAAIAEAAWAEAARRLAGRAIGLDVLVVGREGEILAETGVRGVDEAAHVPAPLNRRG